MTEKPRYELYCGAILVNSYPHTKAGYIEAIKDAQYAYGETRAPHFVKDSELESAPVKTAPTSAASSLLTAIEAAKLAKCHQNAKLKTIAHAIKHAAEAGKFELNLNEKLNASTSAALQKSGYRVYSDRLNHTLTTHITWL